MDIYALNRELHSIAAEKQRTEILDKRTKRRNSADVKFLQQLNEITNALDSSGIMHKDYGYMYKEPKAGACPLVPYKGFLYDPYSMDIFDESSFAATLFLPDNSPSERDIIMRLAMDLFSGYYKHIRNNPKRTWDDLFTEERFDLVARILASLNPCADINTVLSLRFMLFLLDEIVCFQANNLNGEFCGLSIDKYESFFHMYDISNGIADHGVQWLMLCQQYMRQKHKEKRSVDEKCNGNSARLPVMVINNFDERLQITYHKKDRQFSQKQINNEEWREKSFSEGKKEIRLAGAKEAVSDIPIGFLLALCNNDLSQLRDLAKLFACCFSDQKLFRKLIVLNQNKSGYSMLDVFVRIRSLFEPCLFGRYDLKEIARRTAVFRLIQDKLDGAHITLCKKNDPYDLTYDEQKTLKKLVAGAAITMEDKNLGLIKHKNNTQIVLLCSEADSVKFKQYVEVWFPADSFDYEAAVNSFDLLTGEQRRWLQIVFPMWGLLQILEYPNDEWSCIASSVRRFITDCCEVGEKFEVEARVLYNAYKQRYNDEPPLSFKHFNKELEHLFERTRPHHSGGSNPTAFSGIELRTSPANYGPKPAEKSRELLQQLYAIEDEVHDHCDGTVNIISRKNDT